MIDLLCFMIRYTPFWAVPLIFIGLEFGNRYRLKKRKVVSRSFFFAVFFSFTLLVYYYWAGGPEKSVKLFIKYFTD